MDRATFLEETVLLALRLCMDDAGVFFFPFSLMQWFHSKKFKDPGGVLVL